MKKLDKIAIAIYGTSILLLLADIVVKLINPDFYYSNLVVIFILPALIILRIFYKKAGVSSINKNDVNPVSRGIKIFSITFFSLLVATFMTVAVTLNNSPYIYKLDARFYLIISFIFNVAKIFFEPIALILLVILLINFIKNKSISLRFRNLRDAAVAMTYLLIFCQFSKLAWLLLYDPILWVLLKLHILV